MKTFSDLTFVDSSGTTQAIIRFDNGYGVSVIFGGFAISDQSHPYELAVLYFSSDSDFTIVYPSFTRNDTIGHLDKAGVSKYMVLTQKL